MNWEAILAVTTILSLVGELALGIGLYYVGSKASKIDKLEERVSEKAEQLIAERLRAMAVETRSTILESFEERLQTRVHEIVSVTVSELVSEIRVSLGNLNTGIKSLEQRLQRGDGKFDQSDEAWRKLELKVTAAIGEVRQWVLEHYATKEHVRILENKLQAMDNSLARCQARCEAAAEAAAR